MKIILHLLKVYFLLLAVFVSLLFLVHLIPSKWISKNINESISVIEEEGLYPNLLNFKLYQLDNYTDSMMLNIAISTDDARPIYSAMLNHWYSSGQYLKISEDARLVAKGETKGLYKESYARYWHGYLSFLRPALIVFNYQHIRFLSYLTFGFMLLCIGILMKKKIGIRVLLMFLISLAIINFPIVPLSLQFSSVFYIAFGGVIYILSKQKPDWSDQHFYSFFFILGGLTSFIDFLTAPLVTLGFPLTIYLINRKDLNEWINIRSVITGSLTWVIGYGLIWSSKWLIGWLFTGVNILESARKSAALRVSNQWKGMDMSLHNIVNFISENLAAMNLWLPLITMIVFIVSTYLLMNKGIKVIYKNSYLLIILVMVPVWFLIMRNHSIQHGWFTWRALVVSIFSGSMFWYNTTDREEIKRKIGLVNRKRKKI